MIIGGQFKNQVAARYLVFFNQMYPDHQITRKTNRRSKIDDRSQIERMNPRLRQSLLA